MNRPISMGLSTGDSFFQFPLAVTFKDVQLKSVETGN